MSAAATALLRACSLLLCLVAGTRQLSIKEFVVPNAVEIGDQAELRCQYELGPGEPADTLYVKWWWTPESSPSYDRKQIYQRIAGHPAEAIHHANSSKIEIKNDDTIVLAEVTPADSGTYECEVSNIEEIRKHNKLTAYCMGTGPILNISQIKGNTEDERDLLLIMCHADSVAPKPDMIVSLNGQEINMTTFIEDDDGNGIYNIYANTTVDIGELEEKEVRCEIFYSDNTVAHPPYVDVETFVPAGCDLQSTTMMPEDTTEPETTPESLQNYSDVGLRLHCSWMLLAVALLAHLHVIF